MTPWILPWIDTRSIDGQNAVSTTVQWVGGVFESAFKMLQSGQGLSGAPPWGAGQGWEINALRRVFASPTATDPGTLIVPQALQNQGVYVNNGTRVEGIFPSRPLAKDPIAVDKVDGGVVTTLSGLSYRTTYAQRREWVLDLLLDGPLDDKPYKEGYPTYDVRNQWQAFLRRAELGVTVYLKTDTSTSWTTSGNFTARTAPYPGAPCKISGALTDCTSVRWAPGAGDRMMRYAVTMTIAEMSAPGRV